MGYTHREHSCPVMVVWGKALDLLFWVASCTSHFFYATLSIWKKDLFERKFSQNSFMTLEEFSDVTSGDINVIF